MTITEFTNELIELKNKYGDLNVVLYIDSDGSELDIDMSMIDVDLPDGQIIIGP